MLSFQGGFRRSGLVLVRRAGDQGDVVVAVGEHAGCPRARVVHHGGRAAARECRDVGDHAISSVSKPLWLGLFHYTPREGVVERMYVEGMMG